MEHVVDSRIRQYLSLIGKRSKHDLDELLHPYGITHQQARIIGFVISEQSNGRTIYQKDIEEEFELKGSSITSLLQGLERKNFIIRAADAADERKKFVTVLPKAKQLMKEFEDAFHEIDSRMLRNVSVEQQNMLVQLLSQIAGNLET